MRLSALIVSFALLIASAPPGLAQSAQESVVAQLRAQGYARIIVTQTLLGRTRILARADDGRREIILNPRTGEILRDFWEADTGANGPTIIQQGGYAGSGGGRHDDSGSGSGSSGSGSGNSGHGSGDDDDDDHGGDNDNSGKGSGGDD